MIHENLLPYVYGGFVATTIGALVKAGIFPTAVTKGQTLTEVAKQSGADPEVLRNLLSPLVDLDILTLDTEECIGLGTHLKNLSEQELEEFAVVTAFLASPAYLGKATHFFESESDYKNTNDIYQDIEQDTELHQKIFSQIGTFGELVNQKVATAIFNAYGDVVMADIGGGTGDLLTRLHKLGVSQSLTLFDKYSEEVTRGLSSSITFIAGDYFKPFDVSADLFLLKNILHDRDDDQARTILQQIKANLSGVSKLLIIEACGNNNNQFHTWRNITRLLYTGGKERSEQDFAELLASINLKQSQVHTITIGGIYALALRECVIA